MAVRRRALHGGRLRRPRNRPLLHDAGRLHRRAGPRLHRRRAARLGRRRLAAPRPHDGRLRPAARCGRRAQGRAAADERRPRLLGGARPPRSRPRPRGCRAAHRAGPSRPRACAVWRSAQWSATSPRGVWRGRSAIGPRPCCAATGHWPSGAPTASLYSLLAEEWQAAGGGERPAPDEAFLPALAAARTDYRAATPTLPATPPPLGDGAVALRPYTDGDVADLVSGLQRPGDPALAGSADPLHRARRARVPGARGGWLGRQSEALYCIADAASDRLLGGVGLHGDEAWAGVAEIGYHVAPWARRRGVATAAARSVAALGPRRARPGPPADPRRHAQRRLVRRGHRAGLRARRSAPARSRPRGRRRATTPSSRCCPTTRVPGKRRSRIDATFSSPRVASDALHADRIFRHPAPTMTPYAEGRRLLAMLRRLQNHC